MAELKTKKTELSVDAFLKQIPEEQRRKDAYAILQLMEGATKVNRQNNSSLNICQI